MPGFPAGVFRGDWWLRPGEGWGHRPYRSAHGAHERVENADIRGKDMYSPPRYWNRATGSPDGKIPVRHAGLRPGRPSPLGSIPYDVSDDQGAGGGGGTDARGGILLGAAESRTQADFSGTSGVSAAGTDAASQEL